MKTEWLNNYMKDHDGLMGHGNEISTSNFSQIGPPQHLSQYYFTVGAFWIFFKIFWLT